MSAKPSQKELNRLASRLPPDGPLPPGWHILTVAEVEAARSKIYTGSRGGLYYIDHNGDKRSIQPQDLHKFPKATISDKPHPPDLER